MFCRNESLHLTFQGFKEIDISTVGPRADTVGDLSMHELAAHRDAAFRATGPRPARLTASERAAYEEHWLQRTRTPRSLSKA